MPPKPTEHQECKTFVQWANLYQNIGSYLFHIPNEGKRSRWEGKRQKEQGLRKGVPDYMLAIPSNGLHGLFIEIKRSGTQKHAKSLEQTGWIEKLNQRGYRAVFCHGANEAILAVTEYLGKKW